jgi:hypothetical protein
LLLLQALGFLIWYLRHKFSSRPRITRVNTHSAVHSVPQRPTDDPSAIPPPPAYRESAWLPWFILFLGLREASVSLPPSGPYRLGFPDPLSPGLAFVRALAQRENVLVFAGVRKSSPELEAIVAEHPGKVRIVKLTSCDEAENRAAVAEIERVAGRLDVVIANAGMGFAAGSVLETSVQPMIDHFTVNTLGVLVLFQAAYPLLKASTPAPKFIPISSRVGSIQQQPLGMPLLAYGTSKAALNYLAAKLRADHEGLGKWQHVYRHVVVTEF